MKIRRFLVITLILSLTTLTGCLEKNYPENVVAVVNKNTITTEDVEQQLNERNLCIAIANKLNSLDPNRIPLKTAIRLSLNISEEELNPDQTRYLESIERSTTKPLTNNEAFNILLRDEVYCQEALKNGYEVSIDETEQILEQNNKMLSGEARIKQNEMINYAKEIYKQYGFESEEEYLNQRIDKTAQAIAIGRMKNQFNKVIADKLTESNSYQRSIDISNAWDDYGEFLFDRAKIIIVNPEYSIELYGESWNYDVLDLRSK